MFGLVLVSTGMFDRDNLRNMVEPYHVYTSNRSADVFGAVESFVWKETDVPVVLSNLQAVQKDKDWEIQAKEMQMKKSIELCWE